MIGRNYASPLGFKMAFERPPAPQGLRRVLVTGGTGFIGQHLTSRLETVGVSVIDYSQSLGHDVLTDKLPLDGIDHVYHLAGLTYVPRAWEDPVAFYQVNAYGTVRVLDQCRRTDVPLTYLSAYIYGIPQSLPIRETDIPQPSNPYAFSKLAGEEACRFFCDILGARASSLRLFNVYGPRQNQSFLIPTIAKQVVAKDHPEIVVASLAPRRDYIYIDDVVDALVLAAALPSGGVFNIGSGRSYSVGDLIEACMRAAGVQKPFRELGETRNNEIMDTVADITLLSEATGWQPKIGLEQGLARVIESMCEPR